MVVTSKGIVNGFFYNELYRRMDGHILEMYTLKGEYRN